MSYAEIYRILDDGSVVLYGEAQNAHGGASHIWDQLHTKYFGVRFPYEPDDRRPFWELLGARRMTPEEEIVLSFTLDYSWCRREDIPQLVEALSWFWDRNKTFKSSFENREIPVTPTIPQIILVLRDAVAEPESFRGLCFNQTSVNDGVWRVRDPEEGEGSRPFNFDRDTLRGGRHPWNIFDGLEARRQAYDSER